MRLFIFIGVLLQVWISDGTTRAATVSETHLYEPQLILRLTPKEASELKGKEGQVISLEIASRGIILEATLVKLKGRSAIFEFVDNIDFLQEGERIFISQHPAQPYFPKSVEGLSRYYLSGERRADLQLRHHRSQLKFSENTLKANGNLISLGGQINRGYRDSAAFFNFSKSNIEFEESSTNYDHQVISLGGLYSFRKDFFLGIDYQIVDTLSADEQSSDAWSFGLPVVGFGFGQDKFGLALNIRPQTTAEVQHTSKVHDESSDYTTSVWGAAFLEGWYLLSPTRTIFYTLGYLDPPHRAARESSKTKDLVWINFGWQLRQSPISVLDLRISWNDGFQPPPTNLSSSPPIILGSNYYYRLRRHLELMVGGELKYAVDKRQGEKSNETHLHILAGASYVVNQGL